MPSIYLISGPCGCGKTTLAAALSRCLDRQAYLIHGDTFHAGFVQPDDDSVPCTPWEDILRFNWDCIIQVARSALSIGTDVVIDYVVEDELPRIRSLAVEFDAALHYVVLTATENILTERLSRRGDAWLTQRSLFLKHKLENMAESQGHLLDISGMCIDEEIQRIKQSQYLI